MVVHAGCSFLSLLPTQLWCKWRATWRHTPGSAQTHAGLSNNNFNCVPSQKLQCSNYYTCVCKNYIFNPHWILHACALVRCKVRGGAGKDARAGDGSEKTWTESEFMPWSIIQITHLHIRGYNMFVFVITAVLLDIAETGGPRCGDRETVRSLQDQWTDQQPRDPVVTWVNNAYP